MTEDASLAASPGTPWQGAVIVSTRAETPTATTLRLKLASPTPYTPGQYFVVRLTAEDGYTAQRSYSVASAPDGSDEIELTIERMADGEVSPYLCDVAEPGDELDVRGPIGGWFVWDGVSPALLVGGGSGVVPLMAMLRHARATGRSDLLRLVVSARTPRDLYYAAELPGPETTVLWTRAASDIRPAGRITVADLEPLVAPGQVAYVCGSPPFCDTVTDHLQHLSVPAHLIRVERFGPT